MNNLTKEELMVRGFEAYQLREKAQQDILQAEQVLTWINEKLKETEEAKDGE